MFASHHPSILWLSFRPLSQRKSTTSIAISISVLTSPAPVLGEVAKPVRGRNPNRKRQHRRNEVHRPSARPPPQPTATPGRPSGSSPRPHQLWRLGVEVATGERERQRSLPGFLPGVREDWRQVRAKHDYSCPAMSFDATSNTAPRFRTHLIWIKLSVASRHVMRAPGTVRSTKMQTWNALQQRTGNPTPGGRHQRARSPRLSSPVGSPLKPGEGTREARDDLGAL